MAALLPPVSPAIAVLFLLLGLVVLFFGRRLAKATLAIVGFLFGAVVGAGVGLAFAGPVGALAGLVVGGIVGAVLALLAFAFAAVVVGAFAGFVLGDAVAAAFALPWPLAWALAGAALGALVGAFAREALLVVATSLVGADAVVSATVLLLGDRAEALARGDVQLLALLVVAALGMLVQFRSLKEDG